MAHSLGCLLNGTRHAWRLLCSHLPWCLTNSHSVFLHLVIFCGGIRLNIWAILLNYKPWNFREGEVVMVIPTSSSICRADLGHPQFILTSVLWGNLGWKIMTGSWHLTSNPKWPVLYFYSLFVLDAWNQQFSQSTYYKYLSHKLFLPRATYGVQCSGQRQLRDKKCEDFHSYVYSVMKLLNLSSTLNSQGYYEDNMVGNYLPSWSSWRSAAIDILDWICACLQIYTQIL